LAAISGMRLIFAPTSPARRPFASTKPEPPAAASAGMSNRKPHGMAVLTMVTVVWDANSSLRAVESQKVAIVRIASAPASGWMILVTVLLPFLQDRFAAGHLLNHMRRTTCLPSNSDAMAPRSTGARTIRRARRASPSWSSANPRGVMCWALERGRPVRFAVAVGRPGPSVPSKAGRPPLFSLAASQRK
jgi:hypothetical protein